MKLGIYIHIPFCRAKCDYCNFYSVPLFKNGMRVPGMPESYINRLLKEIDTRSASFIDYSVDTIYFGGGTPSLLEPEAICRILNRIHDNFNLCDEGIEITVECNPEDFSRDRVLKYSGSGVNRVSLGVQTLIPRLNAIIGRSSAPPDERILAEFKDIRNVVHSVDLMTAIPEQSEEELLSDLEKIGQFGFEHISAYMLSIEKGTALYKRSAGQAPDEETQRRLFELVIKHLKGMGYTHYEVSNFALPSFESRHNLKYWQFLPYLGLGAAAHSFYGMERYYNPPLIEEYIAGEDPLKKDYRSGDSLIVEYIMTGMRLLEGISLGNLEKVVEAKVPDMIMDKFIELEKQGYIIIENFNDDIRIRFTYEGFFIMDSLIYRITESLIHDQTRRK